MAIAPDIFSKETAIAPENFSKETAIAWSYHY
jgi:hypothetical protein